MMQIDTAAKLQIKKDPFKPKPTCEVSTISLQPKPAAEPKKLKIAKSAGRSSRAVFPSSSNLKFFF